MSYAVETVPDFDRDARKLAKRYPSFGDDLAVLIADLEHDPHVGASLGSGLRKVRMAIASKGKGKSGGARVIIFLVEVDQRVVLLATYDKSDRATIPTKELRERVAKIR